MTTPLEEISVGKVGFVKRHHLWTEEQEAAAERVVARIEEQGIRRIRVSWPDQHGILRGKTLSTHDFLVAMRNGQDFQSATLIMDTTNNIFVPLFTLGGGFGIPEMTGYPDTILVPDPTTYRALPWSPGTGWVLSDMYFSNGTPVPFSTRAILRRMLAELREEGYDYVAGLEVEFYIFKLEDPMLKPEQAGYPPDPPRVSVIAHGFQYLTESRNDEIDEILQLLQDNLDEVGLPLRSIEDEWGPGQCEFTFDPRVGLEAADNMMLFRSVVKQICRRNGYHATFMARPALPNLFSSGWHLHQSLRAAGGSGNAFTTSADDAVALSAVGRHFLAGLLRHADAASVFACPSVNGYKRFQPNSFAPDRACWAVENRGSMVRVIGGPGDETTHLENRAGEPSANPYLFMASQIVAGLDGIRDKLDPGPPDEEPYTADKPPLPTSLAEAIVALKEHGEVFRTKFGDPFMDYLIMLKEFELGRFQSYVTDWEQREYFEVY